MAFSPMNGTPPPWLRDIFGDRAVFWHGVNSEKLKDKNDDTNIVKARANFQLHAQHQPDAAELNATCSLEFIGFVSLLEKSMPFTSASRKVGPAVGLGAVHFPSPSLLSAWRCYYRAVYSNWRRYDARGEYWSVLIYCPVPENNADTCDQFMALYSTGGDVPLVVDVYEWEGGVRRAEVMSYHDVLGTMGSVDSDGKDVKEGVRVNGSNDEGTALAICTAWPYSTSVPKKLKALQALVYEFVRYYSVLGLQMFIYDMRGVNMKGVFESDYAKANPLRGRYEGRINDFTVHYPYTILSLLRPDQPNPHFDNTKPVAPSRHTVPQSLDNDKTLTLSHCRFEARTKYGIEQVLVIDFDEFLYCSPGHKNALKQREYVHDFIRNQSSAGYHAISLSQTILNSKAVNSTIQECVLREVAFASQILARKETVASYNSNRYVKSQNEEAKMKQQSVLDENGKLQPIGSIFNCFSGLRHTRDTPNVKTFHLQHQCPLTNYHHACGPFVKSGDGEASYECTCNVHIDNFRHCSVEHISLHEEAPNRGRRYDPSQYLHALSELYYITNAE